MLYEYSTITPELSQTPYRSSLAHKYAFKRFLALTERGQQALWFLVMFSVFSFTVAYFGAHIMLYLTGYYAHPISSLTAHRLQ